MAQPAHAQSFLAPRATSISSVVVQAANGSPAGLSSRHNGRQQQGSPNEPPRFCTTLFNFADWTARPEAASTAMPADDSVELPLKPSSGLGEPRPTAETSAAESEPQLRPDSNQGASMGPGPLHRHCQPIHCFQTSSPQRNGKAKVLLTHRKAWQFVALSLCCRCHNSSAWPMSNLQCIFA